MSKMIFACGEHGEFGKDDGLPWHVPEDLANFKNYTEDCLLVMSGATFASLPGKLPGRPHYVLSDRESVAKNGAKPDYLIDTKASLRAVCAVLEEETGKTVVVIGGRQMLEEAAEFVTAASITKIDSDEIDGANISIDDEHIIDRLNSRLVYAGNWSGLSFCVLEWSS